MLSVIAMLPWDSWLDQPCPAALGGAFLTSLSWLCTQDGPLQMGMHQLQLLALQAKVIPPVESDQMQLLPLHSMQQDSRRCTLSDGAGHPWLWLAVYVCVHQPALRYRGDRQVHSGNTARLQSAAAEQEELYRLV